MLSLWWLSVAVSCQENVLLSTFHAGSPSINKNGFFQAHYKIKLLIELKIVDPFWPVPKQFSSWNLPPWELESQTTIFLGIHFFLLIVE